MKKQAKKMFDQSTISNDLPDALETVRICLSVTGAPKKRWSPGKVRQMWNLLAFCPTSVSRKGKMVEANLQICKGCGICPMSAPSCHRHGG